MMFRDCFACIRQIESLFLVVLDLFMIPTNRVGNIYKCLLNVPIRFSRHKYSEMGNSIRFYVKCLKLRGNNNNDNNIQTRFPLSLQQYPGFASVKNKSEWTEDGTYRTNPTQCWTHDILSSLSVGYLFGNCSCSCSCSRNLFFTLITMKLLIQFEWKNKQMKWKQNIENIWNWNGRSVSIAVICLRKSGEPLYFVTVDK